MFVRAGELVSRQRLQSPRCTISPARPEPAETGSLSRGRYVEPVSDTRTKLEAFFNILLRLGYQSGSRAAVSLLGVDEHDRLRAAAFCQDVDSGDSRLE